MRKNIFDIMNSKREPRGEINRIESLLDDDRAICISVDGWGKINIFQ